MANIRISQLPTAPSAITGSELVPIVQSGQTVQTTIANILSAPTLTQTFITKNNEPTLPNSRYFAVGSGLSLVDGGAQSTYTIGLTGAISTINALSNGVLVKSGSTVISRSIAISGSGLSVTNGDGVSGDPTIALTGNLLTLASASGTGLVAINGSSSLSILSIIGTTDQISVANGDGASGSPTIAIATNPILPGTASVTVPAGGTSARPSGVNGMIRYNTDTALFEGYVNGVWASFASGSGVTSIATGTGLTGGPITSTGTISIADTAVTAGSYGSTTQVGTFIVNGQGQLTAASNVSITPSGIGAVSSVSGTANEITATGTTNVTLSLPSALTFTGKTVTGGTLTGVAINGSTNTLSNIANSSLTNSSITLGTTNIALGGTSLTPVGLTSVTVTQDPTANFQLATKQYVDTIASTGIHYHEAVYVESPNTAGNLTATYLAGGTSTTITTIASGTYVTFASGVPTIGSQVTTATANGLTSGTQYWVTAIVGGTVQLALTYGGDAITGLTNGTGLSIASVINAGVGATLTNAGAQVALTIDGVLMTVGKRVLIYNQTDATQNGVYTVSVVGTVSTNWVLIRATDANTYSPYSASSLGQGDAFYVTNGNTGAGETYVVTTTGSIFFGQTNITFAQISAAQVYSAGTGLTLTNTTFSISNTAVTAGAYGSASQVATFTVNAQGQLTLAGNTSIAISASQVTSGTLAVAQGGTNLASYAVGDIVYASGTTTLAGLTAGSANYVLTSSGTVPQYVAQSTLSVGSATNATNTTNVALSAGSGATNYLVYSATATGNVPEFTSTGLTYNATNNAITGGINGGTF